MVRSLGDLDNTSISVYQVDAVRQVGDIKAVGAHCHPTSHEVKDTDATRRVYMEERMCG